MLKKFAIVLFSLMCTASFAENLACPQAVPTNSPSFCASYKSVAYCNCLAHGMPSDKCADMNWIYTEMLVIYGTQDRACRAQKETTPQICNDDWNCYRLGGKDSQGRLCSSTGNHC